MSVLSFVDASPADGDAAAGAGLVAYQDNQLVEYIPGLSDCNHVCYTHRTDRRNIDMLNTLLCLQLSVDLGRCGSCILSGCQPPISHPTISSDARGRAVIPAAAAGSAPPDFFAGSALGLRGSRLRGLRVRVASDCRDEGDRERRSKREARRGSGSV